MPRQITTIQTAQVFNIYQNPGRDTYIAQDNGGLTG